jgi:hypothetical protein
MVVNLIMRPADQDRLPIKQARAGQRRHSGPTYLAPDTAASGVNLPALTIAISRGDSLPATPLKGRPGVRTHSSLALMLGAAERTGSRAVALARS